MQMRGVTRHLSSGFHRSTCQPVYVLSTHQKAGCTDATRDDPSASALGTFRRSCKVPGIDVQWSEIMTSKRMVTVTATQFKAHCLEPMDRVRLTGITITITKHGKPVARTIPFDDERRPLFGSLPVEIVGDIIGSSDEAWEAER
jgi:prevent-host-death family protein